MKYNIKFCENCFKNNRSLVFVENKKEYYAGYMACIKPEKIFDTTKCPLCGENTLVETNVTEEELDIIGNVSNYNRQLLDAMIDLKKKDIIEYELKMSQFRNAVQQQKDREKQQEATLKPKCPKCGCTEFVPLRKKWSLFSGFATNKVDMVCKNCGAMKK